MIFTNKQIDEIMKIIDFHHIFFCAGNISVNVLTDKDKILLKVFGIDWRTMREGLTPFQQMYYFGRLAGALRNQTSDVEYKDFKKYIQRGQYNPLSQTEKHTLNYLEKNVYNYITKQRDVIQTQTKQILNEKNSLDEFSLLINEKVKEKVESRKSIQETVLDIGEKTKQWNIDLGRIVETECQNAYSYGKMQALVEKHGTDKIRFFKHVYPGACKHCIKLYLTNGIGSQPRLFTYEELMSNGNNIGLKSKDWQPVLGTVHPFCRCDLDYVYIDVVWNDETKRFEESKSYSEAANKIKGDIIITVGDKTYKV